MARAKDIARGLVAVFALGVCAAPALASPHGARRSGDVEARRRDEIDVLQRQDVADALKKHFNISVDWRTTPLDKLIDIRVRAAKAADLQERLGVSVDWQRYSWIELEALRRTLMSFEGDNDRPAQAAATVPMPPDPPPPSGTDALVRPTFTYRGRPAARAGRVTDPDGVIRPTFTGRVEASLAARDPDGVIRPTFAARPRWSASGADPDGLMTPTFVPSRRGAPMGDADDLIDPTESTESRATRARW